MENYEVDMEIDGEVFDDEETENVVQLDADGVIQPMLLFKLNFKNNNISPVDNVQAMIGEYNSKIDRESEQFTIDFNGEGGVEVYKQTKVSKRSTALYHDTMVYENKITNFITVYYADDGENVYAQTTGNAWRVVTKYGDEEFPVKISGRLLDEKGMKSHARLLLSSNTAYQLKRCKKPERSYQSGTQNLRVRFSADLRLNASIRHPHLNCFAKFDRKIRVKVGYNCVQFDCGIKKDGMKNFINHLNQIDNQRVTYTLNGDCEEDTDAFVEPLRKANAAETNMLNAALKSHMESYIQKKEDFVEHLSDLDLCQQTASGFSYAHNFKICIKRKQIDCSETPTLAMVLDLIRQNTKTTIVRGGTSNNSYTTDNVKIRYDQNKSRINKSLFHLIEGTMMHCDQMCYRIDRNWYYTNEDHIRTVHINFRSFLRDHLITDGPAVLQERWERRIKEGDYNDLYLRNPNFLVGDDCTYGGIELFDLMMYDPQSKQTYLYYVKKKLIGETRILAFQLMTATDTLDKCFIRNPDALTNLRGYYASIVKRYTQKECRLSQYFNTFEKFRTLLSRKNRVTFICAVFEPGADDVLLKERDANDYFGSENIRDFYERQPKYNKKKIDEYYWQRHYGTPSHQIFQSLIEKGYVNASDPDRRNYGHATLKLLLAYFQYGPLQKTSNFFSITEPCDEQLDGIIWKMIRPFSSFLKSTCAKYSLTHMHTNGFNFKICEINELFGRT